MTVNGPQVKKEESPSKKDEVPEEELEILHALKHLDHLHIQCRAIRAALSQMINEMPPLQVDRQPTIPDIYQHLTAHTRSAGIEVIAFEKMYRSEETKTALGQAKKSCDANPKGIKPWLYKDHPDWWDPEHAGSY